MPLIVVIFITILHGFILTQGNMKMRARKQNKALRIKEGPYYLDTLAHIYYHRKI